MNNTFKRSEVKYLLTEEQKISFIKEVSENLKEDVFSNYPICNIYFDTPDFRLIRRSIEKPIYKEKMRLRSYGKADDKTKVFIELKKKYEGIVYKRRISMEMEDAVSYISGMTQRLGQTEEEINYFMKLYNGLSPAMYIAYDRSAYFYKDDPDLRITFDENILWRDQDLSLYSDIYGQQILGEKQSLMEIKCAEAMPLWLVNALSKNRIYQTSFSKYGKAFSKKMEAQLCTVH